MPKKIRISGDIGFTVLAKDIVAQLDAAAGEDLDIEIASPGGSVFDGLEIFNAFRAYKSAHPAAQIMITISGLAASMASYIAAVDVADMVAAYDNSVAMYHSPWNIAIGDFREMQKNADFLKGLSDLLAKAYVTRAGKTVAQIDELMANETWLFGQELKDYGFVDEIIPSGEAEKADKAAAISTAQLKFREMQNRAKGRKEDPERVAAVMRLVVPTAATAEDKTKKVPVVDGLESVPRGKLRRKPMDSKELKAEHSDVYAEVFSAGTKAEQDRVAALAAMKKDKRYEKYPQVLAVIDECIATPDKTTADANALIVAVLSSPSAHAAAESPGDIVTGSVDTPTGEKPKGGAGKEEKPAWKPGQAEEV